MYPLPTLEHLRIWHLFSVCQLFHEFLSQPCLPAALAPGHLKWLCRPSGRLELILYRVMRMRLKAAHSLLSPERALDVLRRIQRHSIKLNNVAPVSGLSSITEEQAKVYQALNIKKPSASEQMSLL